MDISDLKYLATLDPANKPYCVLRLFSPLKFPYVNVFVTDKQIELWSARRVRKHIWSCRWINEVLTSSRA